MANPILDAFERDVVASLLHDAICKHGVEASLSFAAGEMLAPELVWHHGHAKYLEAIKAKLSKAGVI